MISERDRRALAKIEEHLAATDPELVRMFREGPRRRSRLGLPGALIALGVVLAVFGSIISTLAVALLGVAFIVVALYIAALRAGVWRRPRLA
ncbi:DUF3040 domain-containing protein [Pseudonocardia sp.]|uniref:DUF3040 domain-containing protein n=1 Tax=Pseudonocardia sp. TaxID=60912 RepID=UPI003D0DACA7